MGKLKKIALVLVFIVAFTGIMFLRYWAYYPAEKLEISGKASVTPQGALSCIPVGNELALFPETWRIHVDIGVSIYFYKDIKLEEANYVIYLDDEEIAEGSFHDVVIDSSLTTHLPTIEIRLDMKEAADNDPQLIEAAVRNQGKLRLRISVTLTTPAMFLDFIRIGTAEASEDVFTDVNLVDSLGVSSFEWKSGFSVVDDCNPSDALTGEFDISREGVIGERIEAEIIEVINDGSTNTLTRQTLEKGLGYYTLSIGWKVPDSPPPDCIGYSIRLIYEGIEVWCSPIDPPSIRLIRSISLLEAFSEEGITITMRGRGYCSGDTIELKVKAELEVSIDLEVEPGTILINSGAGQNMITAETSTVRLEPGIEIELNLEAYCLDLYRDNPNSSEAFRISEDLDSYCVEAVELMQSLRGVSWEHKSVSGIQLALWVVIEDPPRDEVERIFWISESALEDAAWLLENIGIDPNEKRLFIEG